jgi:site-specific DNA-methyltransferase (adenine-specific)
MDLLNKEELNELERCELVIKQGLQTFIEVGQALLTIRDKKLYRAEYQTFKKYCEEKWAFKESRVYELISASVVVDNIQNSAMAEFLPQNEKQARPLTQLEPELQSEAWQAVIGQHGEHITALKVKEIADQFKEVNNELRQAKAEPMFTANTPEELIRKAKEIARERAIEKEELRQKKIEQFNRPITKADDKLTIHCWNEDCVTGMDQKELQKCSLLLTDPPYGMNFKSNQRTIGWDRIANDQINDTIFIFDKSLKIVKKHLLPDAHFYIFGHPDFVPQIKPIIEKYFTLKSILIWDREVIGMGDLKNYGRSYDVIYFGYNEQWKDLHGQRDRDVLRFNRVSPNNLTHPTEKPIELLEYLIKKSTNEGDFVIDPFAGSCSTLKSAQSLNRNAYGFELNNKYIPNEFRQQS